METRIVEKWTVKTAQIENTVRKSSLAGVLDNYLRGLAKSAEIENYKELLESIRENPALYDSITEAERTFYDTAAGLGAWVPITACISPYIPIGEWRLLNEETLDKLSSAAMELNPHWFEMPTVQTEKKSKRKHRKSTQN